ncbi:hypothetical protein [Sphingomonas bisphenolicum]|uniref:Uncharacterized protein n=1 Tax=Sphingomonas bisphenolicum TaxID=296544 RepID=A0ABM7G2P2_9SPHN|nr:hypothetical protein [Sphingomonas bisphenolicum]BBF68822.1 hypothetical protein SBA_ch1_10220 [Sphingomonas bisphenolicum]
MADDDFIRAGAIILRDLAVLNRATIFYEEQVVPIITNAVETLIREWVEEKLWKGEIDAPDTFTTIWVCPGAWQNDSEEEPLARFTLGHRNEEATSSYEIADLLNLGQTDFGFWFEPEYSWFGGKSTWNAFSKTIADIAEELGKKGWINEGKGIFFRPIALAADLRVSAWENEDWSEVLAPLRNALDELEADQSTFDKILMRGNPKRA